MMGVIKKYDELKKRLIQINSFIDGIFLNFSVEVWKIILEFIIGVNERKNYKLLNPSILKNNPIFSYSVNPLSDKKRCFEYKLCKLKSNIFKLEYKLSMYDKIIKNKKKIEFPEDIWKQIKVYMAIQDIKNYDELKLMSYKQLKYTYIFNINHLFQNVNSKFINYNKTTNFMKKYILKNKEYLCFNKKDLKKIFINYYIKLYILFFSDYTSLKQLDIEIKYIKNPFI
jgi:hypothetical protein